jgi:hypothetical protein
MGVGFQSNFPIPENEVECEDFRESGILRRMSMHQHNLKFYASTQTDEQLNGAEFIRGFMGLDAVSTTVRGHMLMITDSNNNVSKNQLIGKGKFMSQFTFVQFTLVILSFNFIIFLIKNIKIS